MFTPSDCKDIGVRTFEFVAKTQFLSYLIEIRKSGSDPSKARDILVCF